MLEDFAQELPKKVQDLLKGYESTLKFDLDMTVLRMFRESLSKRLEANAQAVDARKVELARKIGVILPDVNSVREMFKGYDFVKLPNLFGERSVVYGAGRPYDVLEGRDSESIFRLYFCCDCKGWIPGEPFRAELSPPSPLDIDKIYLSYSCRVCGDELARDAITRF